MKFRALVFAFSLVLGAAFGGASHAHADYTLWTPTTGNDQNIFSFNLTPQTCTMGADLLIYAPGYAPATGSDPSFNPLSPGPGNYLLLQIQANQLYSGTDFTIEQTGGIWGVYNAGNVLILTLGSTNQFGLYYYYNNSILQPTITAVSGLPDEWVLNNGVDACVPVLVVDAAPAPLPGTLLLFGPGLIGLIGIGRKCLG